jgi:hypothetical protein
MEHTKHVFRVVIFLAVVLTAFFLTRGFLVPKSYGEHGPYRYDNVAEQMQARVPAHAGPAACAACHKEQSAKRTEGAHKTVSCEVCHGPLAFHVKDEKKVAAASVDRTYALCARCHRKILGRPAKFPQVDLEQHVKGALEAKPCIQCHDPHSPSM